MWWVMAINISICLLKRSVKLLQKKRSALIVLTLIQNLEDISET